METTVDNCFDYMGIILTYRIGKKNVILFFPRSGLDGIIKIRNPKKGRSWSAVVQNLIKKYGRGETKDLLISQIIDVTGRIGMQPLLKRGFRRHSIAGWELF